MTQVTEAGSDRDVLDLIAAHPLAWMVTSGEGRFAATPTPLLADVDKCGALVGLTGHVAWNNPQVAMLRADPRAAFLFLGAHAYVSPSWMRDRTQAPTWNYASATIEGDVRFDGDLTDEALGRLVETMEAGRHGGWSILEMGERYDRLKKGVVAFRVDAVSVAGRFKLGQSERDDVYVDVVEGLHEPEVVAWMTRFNPERSPR